MTFDHERLRRDLDRSATAALVRALAAPELDAGARHDVAVTLSELDDPASWGPLVAIVEDHALPRAPRSLAAELLREGYFTPTSEQLRSWWTSGDLLQQRHAILSMGADFADVVAAVAADPAHPVHRDAIETLDFGFEQPRFQALKIAALSHTDPIVRMTAASTLLWDEPLRAEGPLIDALADPDIRVVAAAANALQYYPSQRAWRALVAIRDHPDDSVRLQVACSTTSRAHFLAGVTSPHDRIREHLRRWLAPIWDSLVFSEEELRPEPAPAPARQPQDGSRTVPRIELEALLVAPASTPLRQALRTIAWTSYTGAERASLADLLVEHPDPRVREDAAHAFHHWRAPDRLMRLAADPCFIVAKAAFYWLGHTPPFEHQAAELAWRRLAQPFVMGTHAGEVLDTYARCADRDEAIARLAELVRDDERPESLRARAARQLVELAARDELRSLVDLLTRPPPVTWALHIALLDAAAALRLPAPDIAALVEADNADLQKALVPFLA